ncbi:VOC family protein [Gordonia sp. zg691]|uniref:VOC family protein n=1 Tax=Gordonia jinghuaiqii TaxID=2758710 RepID=A0A7D7LPD1_9ACTN|nr:VOC family protein [Gordonia jinghuaiqii]MBD0862643.1 VOC family protein [Gordonia jinghuaiqii]MCR5976725.1 VOC family protein [Gordonia jinghuaiqii]QMS99902.1 VOC family protein [Gordonia jinghuaiqii]
MTVTATTHLNFAGNARDALEFYASVFDGELTVATYGDFGMPRELPGADQVVFGQVTAASGFQIMAYDAPGQSGLTPAPAATTTRRENGTTVTDSPFFVSVRGARVDEIAPLWDKLSDGAQVIEEFGPAPWAPAFGMLADRFGVTWILDVAVQYADTGA